MSGQISTLFVAGEGGEAPIMTANGRKSNLNSLKVPISK